MANVTAKAFFKGLNSINGDLDKFDSFVNCNNDADINSLDFASGYRCVMPLLSDENMGKAVFPLVRFEGDFIFYNNDVYPKFASTNTDFNYKNERNANDVNRRLTGDTVNYTYLSCEDIVNSTIEWKCNYDFSGYDKVVIVMPNTPFEFFKQSITVGNGLSTYYPYVPPTPLAYGIKNGVIDSSGAQLFLYVNDEPIYRMSTGRCKPDTLEWENYGGCSTFNSLWSLFISHLFSGYGIVNTKFKLSSNCWIFETLFDARAFLERDDYSNAINYDSAPLPPEPTEDLDETKEKKYFIYSQKWERASATDGEKTIVENHRTEIILKQATRRPFTLTVNEDNTLHLNTGNVDYDIFGTARESSDGGETWRDISLNAWTNDFWFNSKTVKVGNKYYGANVKTNIPIFDSIEKSDLYINEEIDESNSIDALKSAFNTIDNMLIDMGYSVKNRNELNIDSVRTEMSEIITGNSAFFGELASLFNDDSLVTQIKQGLQMHSNPYDIFIDFYALPFSINGIEELSSSQNSMDFGTYNHTFNTSFKRINKPIEFTMCNTDINPIYNDWRDYQCNLYLYLPYVNFINISTSDFMGKHLRVNAIFDIPSSTIKYYIKANNVTILTVEGCVRFGLPLSASNNVQGFMNKLGGASQVIQGVQEYNQLKYDAVGGLGALLEGDIGGAVQELSSIPSKQFQSVSNIIGGVADIMRPTPKVYSGNYSSSTAFYDELMCYLFIEQSNYMYDDKIKQEYNLADNRVGTLSTCRGYTEIDTIDLQVNTSEDIRQEIISILMSGVYC